MKIDRIECTTMADGISVDGGYDLGIFHKPGATSVIGLLGDGVEFVGRFEIKREAVARMANTLGVVTTGGKATPNTVDALAQTLAAASGVSNWDNVSESDGGQGDHDGRGYWRRLASTALDVPFTVGMKI